MMIGEFEYTAIFDAMRTSDAFEDQVRITYYISTEISKVAPKIILQLSVVSHQFPMK